MWRYKRRAECVLLNEKIGSVDREAEIAESITSICPF
jgi:hypothetical protein